MKMTTAEVEIIKTPFGLPLNLFAYHADIYA